jgi:hypothetical protein
MCVRVHACMSYDVVYNTEDQVQQISAFMECDVHVRMGV